MLICSGDIGCHVTFGCVSSNLLVGLLGIGWRLLVGSLLPQDRVWRPEVVLGMGQVGQQVLCLLLRWRLGPCAGIAPLPCSRALHGVHPSSRALQGDQACIARGHLMLWQVHLCRTARLLLGLLLLPVAWVRRRNHAWLGLLGHAPVTHLLRHSCPLICTRGSSQQGQAVASTAPTCNSRVWPPRQRRRAQFGLGHACLSSSKRLSWQAVS